MEYLKVILLAITQGLTEFLPVSSSGHLVLVSEMFGINYPGITMEVFLHFGTFLSVLVVFRKEISKIFVSFFKNFWRVNNFRQNMKEDEYFAMSIFMLIAIIPAGVVGVFFKDFFESLFHNIHTVAIALIITGTILFLTQWAQNKNKKMNLLRALIIGISQAIAIIPGISRSGSTISAGLFLGMDKKKVARFSFILALPLVFGATILETKNIIGATAIDWRPILIGTVIAFITGFYAIKWILYSLLKGKFYIFSYYCVLVGFFVLAFN
ncbi:MAG: undecaprenyl-diphosphate phosphatase [Candidatus Marinimicrobia bacterium]|nr:undecaprenyl-diphosphate phosphatase [Candidatus Neomarinimicrobiota bacterium]